MWLRPLPVLTLLGLVGLACAVRRQKDKELGGLKEGLGPRPERVVDPRAMESEAKETVKVLKEYRNALQKHKKGDFRSSPELKLRHSDELYKLNTVLLDPDAQKRFMDLYSASDGDVLLLCGSFTELSKRDFSATSLDKETFSQEIAAMIKAWDQVKFSNSPHELMEFVEADYKLSSDFHARGSLMAAIASYTALPQVSLKAPAFSKWVEGVWDQKQSQWTTANSFLAKQWDICSQGGDQYFANAASALKTKSGAKLLGPILGGITLGVITGLGVEYKLRKRTFDKELINKRAMLEFKRFKSYLGDRKSVPILLRLSVSSFRSTYGIGMEEKMTEKEFKEHLKRHWNRFDKFKKFVNDVNKMNEIKEVKKIGKHTIIDSDIKSLKALKAKKLNSDADILTFLDEGHKGLRKEYDQDFELTNECEDIFERSIIGDEFFPEVKTQKTYEKKDNALKKKGFAERSGPFMTEGLSVTSIKRKASFMFGGALIGAGIGAGVGALMGLAGDSGLNTRLADIFNRVFEKRRQAKLSAVAR